MNWGLFALAAGTAALLAFVVLNALAAARLLRHRELPYNPLLNPWENLGRALLVGLSLLLAAASGLPGFVFGLQAEAPLADLLVSVVAAAVLQEINFRGSKWAAVTFGPSAYSPAFLRAILPTGSRDWAVAIAALLPAAFAEEILFRGLAIGGLSQFLPPLLLVVLTGVLFGVVHLPQGRIGVAGAAALGVALGALFLWRWSLLACTVAHYGINLAQLLRGREELRWLEGPR